ncbi:alkaline phosphatase family protein [bacterium]|nr:alkaline phosphatase family protein [bacterium]
MNRKAKLITIGLDAATWKIITPNLKRLPHFATLIKQGKAKTLIVPDKEEILSPPIWCSMFSGKTQEEHGHLRYVVNNHLVKRKDIKVDFVWDVLDRKGISVVALQIPFVMPPFNFHCHYEPVGYGASYDLKELEEDTDGVFFKAVEILKKPPEVFIVVFTALDRVQHFHWGEPLVISWYEKMDKILGVLEKYAEKLIVVSDHGFCGIGEARTRTLPEKNDKGEELKGDHHQEAILITRGIDYPINKHEDLFFAILKEVKNAKSAG